MTDPAPKPIDYPQVYQRVEDLKNLIVKERTGNRDKPINEIVGPFLQTLDPAMRDVVAQEFEKEHSQRVLESIGRLMSEVPTEMKKNTSLTVEQAMEKVGAGLGAEVAHEALNAFPLVWTEQSVAKKIEERIEIDTAGNPALIVPTVDDALPEIVRGFPSIQAQLEKVYRTQREPRIETTAQRVAVEIQDHLKREHGPLSYNSLADILERDPSFQGGVRKTEEGVGKDIRLEVALSVLTKLPDEQSKTRYGVGLVHYKMTTYLQLARDAEIPPSNDLTNMLLDELADLLPEHTDEIKTEYRTQLDRVIQDKINTIQHDLRAALPNRGAEIRKVISEKEATLKTDMIDPTVLTQAIAGLSGDERIACATARTEAVIIDEIQKGKSIEDAVKAAIQDLPDPQRDAVETLYEQWRQSRLANAFDEAKVMTELPLPGKTAVQSFVETIKAMRAEPTNGDIVIDLLKQLGEDNEVLSKIGVASGDPYKKFVHDQFSLDLERFTSPPVGGPAAGPDSDGEPSRNEPPKASGPTYEPIRIGDEVELAFLVDGKRVKGAEIEPPLFVQDLLKKDDASRKLVLTQAETLRDIIDTQLQLQGAASIPPEVLKIAETNNKTIPTDAFKDVPTTFEDLKKKFPKDFPQKPPPLTEADIAKWRQTQFPIVAKKYIELLWTAIQNSVKSAPASIGEILKKINGDKKKPGIEAHLEHLKTLLRLERHDKTDATPEQAAEQPLTYLAIGKEKILYDGYSNWEVTAIDNDTKVATIQRDVDGFLEEDYQPIETIEGWNVELRKGYAVHGGKTLDELINTPEDGWVVKEILEEGTPKQTVVVLEKQTSDGPVTSEKFFINAVRRANMPFAVGSKVRVWPGPLTHCVVGFDRERGQYILVDLAVPKDQEATARKVRAPIGKLCVVNPENDWHGNADDPELTAPADAARPTAETPDQKEHRELVERLRQMAEAAMPEAKKYIKEHEGVEDDAHLTLLARNAIYKKLDERVNHVPGINELPARAGKPKVQFSDIFPEKPAGSSR